MSVSGRLAACCGVCMELGWVAGMACGGRCMLVEEACDGGICARGGVVDMTAQYTPCLMTVFVNLEQGMMPACLRPLAD